MDLTGQKVLITGGTRGIGLATTQKCLTAGAEVAVWSLHQDSLDHAQAQCSQTFFGQPVDVGDRDSVTRAAKTLAAQFGTIDILINNAGYTMTSPFLTEDEAYWQRVINTNLWGVMHTMYAFLPAMKEAGQGAVVNVVSDAARVGMSGEAVYAAAKGGVISFSKSMARESAKQGVRVNCVSPGPTNTDTLTANSENADKLIDKMIKQIPLRDIAQPEQIADTILFLASQQSSHMTGQVLSVSGGLTMSD